MARTLAIASGVALLVSLLGSTYNLSNVDVTSLALSGDATILAGAATSGTESAFSTTQDGGTTWNHISIDTDISTIVDLAISPNYRRDDTLFMLTYGGEHRLWRSSNDGDSWQEVFSSTPADVDRINLIELPPQYGSSQVVFLAGISNGNPVIWRSTDSGQNFTRQSAPLPIDIWAVVNDTTLFAGSYDGSNGLVYRTTNSGLTYSTPAVTGNQSLNSIALSPDYDRDKTILAGNTDGWVYWSEGGGDSFEPLPPDATSPPLTGVISVAFDPNYRQNNTVYAASDTADEGIYRFIIGASDAWENIDSNLPSEGMIGQLMASAEGTLYATNFKADGGIERCLNPTYSSGPTFETVTRGLDDGAKLCGLWWYGYRLWSVDTSSVSLMTYTDGLALPVTLDSPPDEAPDTGTITNDTITNVSLDWETLSGATKYQWQLDYDTDFSSVPTEFEGNTKASSARLPALEPDTTYHWRVRATKPLLSPWSAKWSFTTSPKADTAAPQLSRPEAGAISTPVKPVFQWGTIAWADSYELLVAANASFTNPLIAKIGNYALPSSAWQCDIALDHNTTYYWKVRAADSHNHSDWSAVGTFTTELPPSSESVAPTSPEPVSPPPPKPPPASPEPSMPMWVIYLVGALLLTVIVLFIVILRLVARRPH